MSEFKLLHKEIHDCTEALRLDLERLREEIYTNMKAIIGDLVSSAGSQGTAQGSPGPLGAGAGPVTTPANSPAPARLGRGVLVAFTSYDPDTRLLEGYAKQLLNELSGWSPRIIPPQQCLAGELQNILGQSEDPLFFLGHGMAQPSALIGQDRQPVIDLGALSLLANRLIWAASCYSADILGSAVVLGATVFGYSGKLRLARQQPYSAALGNCLLTGPRELLAGNTVEVAFLRTQGAYLQEALRLRGGTFDDGIIAVWVFEWNARAVRLQGDRNRRL